MDLKRKFKNLNEIYSLNGNFVKVLVSILHFNE